MSARLPMGVGTRNNEGLAEAINSFRQFPVEVGYGVASIVGRQLNANGIVCICPRGMMVHFFGDQCYAGHECESFGEVLELIVFRELVVCLFPHNEWVCETKLLRAVIATKSMECKVSSGRVATRGG